jgi:hypothetical protein
MTLAVAWLRHVQDVRELVLASDSRLTGGYSWDACPKIVPLARQDCALLFAGDTAFAYPVMLQVASAVSMYSKSLDRSQDIFEFKGKVLEIINEMRRHIHSRVVAEAAPGEEKTYLLLAGYSWRRSDFAIWTLHFDESLDAFTFRPATRWRGIDGSRLLAVAGDSVREFKGRLTQLLAQTNKLDAGGFDMEPFEVLRDIIRTGINAAIGGPPQIVKIYRHMNVTPFPVYWPTAASRTIAMFGRPLLDYELPETGVLDPDTLEIVDPRVGATGLEA